MKPNKNNKPISSKDIKVDVNRLKGLGIINEYTGDLFGMEDCSNCDGSGQIKYIKEDRIEDCDICNK